MDSGLGSLPSISRLRPVLFVLIFLLSLVVIVGCVYVITGIPSVRVVFYAGLGLFVVVYILLTAFFGLRLLRYVIII